MLHIKTPAYILNYTPVTRPAFEFDVFDEKGNIIDSTCLFIDCHCCNRKHRLTLILPPLDLEGRDQIIEAAKAELKRKIDQGELYASENNINFQISLNIN